MKALPPCPHCNRETGTYRKARASGPVELYYDEAGREEEVTYDDLAFTPYSQAIRCDNCLKIRRDLVASDRQIEEAP